MQVLLARPRGFCAGVERAIEIVELALRAHGAPVYVYHQIVHNAFVVADLGRRGAVFVDDIDAIPAGATTVFSAHGVSDAVVRRAAERGLVVSDATCPLVSKVHQQARRYAGAGRAVIIVGHRGHDEVEGTAGSVPGPVHVVADAADVGALPLRRTVPVAYVTQTTLASDEAREAIDALHRRFDDVAGPELDGICYATQNRQQAVRALAARADVLLVVGAHNSSNSCRLAELGQRLGLRAHLVADDGEVDGSWFGPADRVGVTAGASTPEVLVRRVVARLFALGAESIQELDGPVETESFRPRIAATAAAS